VRPPPLTAVLLHMVPLSSGKYICIICKLMQTFSVILTCFAADVLDRAHLSTEAPYRGFPMGRLCRHITSFTFGEKSLFIAVVFLIQIFFFKLLFTNSSLNDQNDTCVIEIMRLRGSLFHTKWFWFKETPSSISNRIFK